MCAIMHIKGAYFWNFVQVDWALLCGFPHSLERIMKKAIVGLVLANLIPSAQAADPAVSALAGIWTLVAADVEHADGRRLRDYGASPKGRLMIGADGSYSLQIFKSERAPFASNDKSAGSEVEFKSAVLGSSTHYGSIGIDDGKLAFHIEGASFPNWEGTTQRRSFALSGDELSYRVPARADGGVPISVWRRVQ
jgi:hypothetical protein